MLQFEFKAYRRSFSSDWKTAAGAWAHREGIVIKLSDSDGRIGFGEIAPIESFGSERFPSALAVCEELVSSPVERGTLAGRVASWPATRYAVESALEELEGRASSALSSSWPVCGLLRQLDAVDEVRALLGLGYVCLKAKIGVNDFDSERAAVERIAALLGDGVSLRLDANGSLDLRAARQWLERLADIPGIEYLEQPLAKGREETMAALSGDYPTPIALDESVCLVDDLKRWRDFQWPGLYVIKPSLCGSRRELVEELSQGRIDAVFSSALETRIGIGSLIGLALAIPLPRRALGIGTDRLFGRDLVAHSVGPRLQKENIDSTLARVDLWNRI